MKGLSLISFFFLTCVMTCFAQVEDEPQRMQNENKRFESSITKPLIYIKDYSQKKPGGNRKNCSSQPRKSDMWFAGIFGVAG